MSDKVFKMKDNKNKNYDFVCNNENCKGWKHQDKNRVLKHFETKHPNMTNPCVIVKFKFEKKKVLKKRKY